MDHQDEVGRFLNVFYRLKQIFPVFGISHAYLQYLRSSNIIIDCATTCFYSMNDANFVRWFLNHAHDYRSFRNGCCK